MTEHLRRIRLDPWAPEYESAVQLVDAEEESSAVELRVESRAWAPSRPAPQDAESAPLAFVDGVRRIERRLIVEEGPRRLFGLLGSFAVGSVEVDGAAARVTHQSVERVVAVGGGVLLERLEAPLPAARTTLAFDPRAAADNTPVAPVQALQTAMREREAQLADRLSAGRAFVFLDGPLTFLAGAAIPVIGFVKRLMQSYLPAAEATLLPDLRIGERTPLFLIRGARYSRYSWYARIACGRPIESPLTGVVRLEVSSGLARDAVAALADLSARVLPRFASRPERDPRAPQNLYPIGGLEAQLRRWLGDALVVRRAIEARLQREVA